MIEDDADSAGEYGEEEDYEIWFEGRSFGIKYFITSCQNKLKRFYHSIDKQQYHTDFTLGRKSNFYC